MVEVKLTFKDMDEMLAHLGKLTVHNLAAGKVQIDEAPAPAEPERGEQNVSEEQDAPEKPEEELDAAGESWNPDLHAGSKAKNADGAWRRKRGVKPAEPKTKPTIDDLRDATEKLHETRGMGVTRDVVGRFKKEDGSPAGKLSDLQESDYPAFLAECQKEMA